LITAGSLCGLLSPLILKWLIDHVFPGRETRLLAGLVALLFVASIGKALLTSLGAYLSLNAAQRTSVRLRTGLLRHLDRLSADYYEHTSVGAVFYPMKEPIEEISYLGSDLLPSTLRVLLASGFTIVAMFMLSPLLTLTILPVAPAFVITRQYFRKRFAVESDSVQQSRISWSNYLQEHLADVVSIQLLRQQRRQERKAFGLLAKTIRCEQGLFRTGIYFSVVTSIAVVSAMSWVIGLGGWAVVSGRLSIGSLVAFYGFLMQFFEPLSSVAELYARAQKTFASIRQLQVVLRQRPSITNPVDAPVLRGEQSWQLDFRDVKFRYRERENGLSIPSLQILAGEQVAIAGENGAGKSTLVKLIVRVYDPDTGSICIGGRDIKTFELESLRLSVAYLPRDPTLFDGSIEENLRFASPMPSEDQLQDVIQCADMSRFVTSVHGGIKHKLGPRGCRLSGGQRQRLAIARALITRPRIMIFDEATSCLDPLSEELILNNVHLYLPTSTLIVISHRQSTIAKFRRVLTLAGGRIAADSGGNTSEVSLVPKQQIPLDSSQF